MRSGGRPVLWPAVIAAAILALCAVLYLGFRPGPESWSRIANSDTVAILASCVVLATLVAASSVRPLSVMGGTAGIAGVVAMFALVREPVATPPDMYALAMLGFDFARGLLLTSALFAGLVCLAALIANLTQVLAQRAERESSA